MAGYDGSLKFDTSIITDGFNKGITKLGSIAKTGLAVLSAALGGATVAGLKYNASIETYQTSFEVMTGSAEKAAEVIDRLKKVGAETPFELPDLADTTQLLMNYGLTADEAMDKMMMLGDISQGSADKMSRIAMAYGQMSSAGKVQLEDVKQMIEAGFNPLQEISESTGESMSSLYDRISKGTLSVDEITASMERATSAGGKYYQSMQKQSQTFSGMISTLKDNAQQLLGEVVQPISDSMVGTLLPAAIDAIDQMSNAFQTQGVDGLIQAGSQILVNLLTGITQGLPGIISTAVQIITSIVDNLTANVPQLLNAGIQILQAIINGMIQLLPSIGTFILALITAIYEQLTAQAPMLLKKGYEILNNLITGFVQAIPEMLPRVLDFIQGIGEKLAEAAPILIQKGFELLSKLVEGITTALPILIAKVPEIISTFANVINDNFPIILMKGVELIGQLILGILQAIPTLVANIPKIVTAIVDVITAYNWLALGKNIITFFKNGISSMIGAVKSTAKNVQDGIINAIKNLPNTLSNLGKSAISNLGNAIRNGISSVVGQAKSIVSGIKNAFTSINWGSIGSNIISGIANGIAGAIGGLVDAAVDAARSAFNAAKDFLGINSPSRLFRDQVGKYMALGMGVGFEQNVPTRDMTDSLAGAVGQMQKKVASITTRPTSAIVYKNDLGNNKPGGAVQPFDYERMGQETAKAMEGMGIYMDSKPVGKLVTPTVNDELGKLERRKT